MTAQSEPNIALHAERATLGGLLITCDIWPPEVDLLSPGHFSCSVRARIFRSVLELHDAQTPADTLSVLAALRDVSNPPVGGWRAYLAELSQSTPTAANVDHYATLVLQESRRRDYVEVMTDAVNSAKTQGIDADNIATAAILRLGRIADGREIARPVPMRDLMRAELEDLDARRASGAPVGHQTGFEELDGLTCGLVPGHLVIIAGRPSMGKSSLARVILNRLGARGIPGVLYSFEMSEQEIGQASIAAEARINLQAIRSAKLNAMQYEKVVEAMATLHNNRLAVVDRPGMTIAEIRTTARAYAARNKLGVIAVDYMQLAVGRGQTREQEIASISRGLKALAKELHVPVIGLSQLNRGLESRDNKRPRLSDLRESGSIEQDADEVIFLYRDEYYDKSTKDKGIAELGIAKNRNGPTGMVKLKWFGEFTLFAGLQDGNRELF